MNLEEENKLKEIIMNDMDFRIKCHSLGIKWDNFSIGERYGNEPITIVVGTSNKDVFVFMDEEYNVIGVHRFSKFEKDRSLYNAIYNARSIYNYTYVLYDLTIRDIVELANRTEVTRQNHGNSLRMIVNGEDVNLEHGEHYIELLSYIKFIGRKIENYYKNLYKARILGIEYPSVISYVISLVNNIDNCINEKIESNTRPWPIEILGSIGDNSDDMDQNALSLYNIINLLLYEKGYKIGSGNDYLKIKPLDEEKEDLYKKSRELLGLLDVSKDEVKERFYNARHTLKFNDVNLEELLSFDEKTL